MPLLSADLIYTPAGFLQDHCLECTDAGEIISLRPRRQLDAPIHHAGLLLPGFVNAHCHSELSMMEGKLTEGAGMATFIEQIISLRGTFSEEDQRLGVEKAFAYMWESGTVLLGDISNAPVSIETKRRSPLRSYTFVEVFALGEGQAQETFERGLDLLQQFEGLSVSLTHHAPYTMSSSLIRKVYEHAAARQQLLSIHLLESQGERALFEEKGGPFVAVFQKLGIPFAGFAANTAQAHMLADMDASQPALFVHNTEMTAEELDTIAGDFPHTFFCLCPRSNYFIHRTWPDAELFARYSDRICLGTDSIASNYSLDLFEEVKVLHERHPALSLHTLLKWATTNGAAALHQSGNFGTFAPGTRPGINLLRGIDIPHLKLSAGCRITKLA